MAMALESPDKRDCKVSFFSPLQLSSPARKYSPNKSNSGFENQQNQSGKMRKNVLLVD